MSAAAPGHPPRFLADVIINARILAGLKRLAPSCDALTAQDSGMATLPDPELLQQAAAQDRILLTHDVNTMITHSR
jgi:predicted nuclease of predicted toxin-antitoxin system